MKQFVLATQEGQTVRKQIKSKISNALNQNCSRGLRSSKSSLLKKIKIFPRKVASPKPRQVHESTIEADKFEETKKIQQIFVKPSSKPVKRIGSPEQFATPKFNL
mmetsp:Transcript_23920/g.36600  ORF Transcript_23920/g.36600 Transcript_23920/m.36600 type:complete len:105 (+) Transcript_23920:488-802(+)